MDRLTTRTKIVYALRGAIAIVVAVAAAVGGVIVSDGANHIRRRLRRKDA